MNESTDSNTGKKKVMIGMSGGVDSSVAAALLIEQGYEVVGVTLKLWAGDESDGFEYAKDSTCCSLDDINDARMVCYKIGIPHYVLNFKDVFKSTVVDYFVEEYKSGKTPNPCIACNKFIKMGGMLEKAVAMGFDYIATGHYSRILFNSKSCRYELHKGASIEKDQSYVLYNFTQYQLAHTLMPLGEYTKEQTREIARKYSFGVANKPDSQEICFVPDQDYATFMEQYTGEKSIPGNFVDKTENVLGQHKGITHFTVGQRKGLGIAFGERMFVTGINPANNEVVLGKEEEIFRNTLIAGNLNYIEIPELKEPMEIEAKIRYSAKAEMATIEPLENNTVKIVFRNPVRAITPGQAVVFYKENSVIGGGTIAF